MINQTLNANGRLLLWKEPVVMGILNATPDSFYNSGRESDPEQLLRLAEKMLEAGALILDIGGMSTRPGAEEISMEQEWQRLAPVIKLIRKNFPAAILSVDTYRSEIVKRSADQGIDIINDISAGTMDESILQTVAGLNLPYIAMHMQGRPQTMQHQPQYKDLVQDILEFFIGKIKACYEAGIKDLILDPGFGFGKTTLQNYELLKGLHQFSIFELPVLVGISRKSMINKVLLLPPAEALNGTTALHMIALQQGAAILRVHDVKEAMECIKLWQVYQEI
jgi:dihydropteroate synthase